MFVASLLESTLGLKRLGSSGTAPMAEGNYVEKFDVQILNERGWAVKTCFAVSPEVRLRALT